MGSYPIDVIRETFGEQDDAAAAAAFAREYGFVAIVRYKNTPGIADFTDIGACRFVGEINGYMTSRYCHEVEVLYDARESAIVVSRAWILDGSCARCGRRTTEASLALGEGDEFYVCPNCGSLYCDACYGELPLLTSPGYGACARCRVEVVRALPGTYVQRVDKPATDRRPAAKDRPCGAADPEL